MTNNLSQKKCVLCEGGVPPMDKWLAMGYLKEIPGWEILEEERKIKREFKFKDFRSAMAFANKVADLAEAEQHHPNFYIFYNRVTLELWTHAIGGLSENDFILAAKINNIGVIGERQTPS